MGTSSNTIKERSGFRISKWYLDCVTDEGEAMIFYAAQLNWHGFQVPYTSWLHYKPTTGTTVQSRLRRINMPKKDGESICWQDSRFGISGSWEAITPALNARLFNSDDGYLDWSCYQPVSRVRLSINDRIIEGLGYAEQLILTVEPWKIPMEELRWGRYGTGSDSIVWIELRGVEQKQWVWYNGESTGNIDIQDNKLVIPERNLILDLDKGVVLESEKKIFNVVKTLLNYIPGFNKSMPSKFLMSDEFKWRSKAILKEGDKVKSKGWAIHECVKFRNERVGSQRHSSFSTRYD